MPWRSAPATGLVLHRPVAGFVSAVDNLGQSIILTALISGYGLALLGAVDWLTATAFAIVGTAGLVQALSI